MCNEVSPPVKNPLDAMMQDARRWAALRDNGWAVYEVVQQVRRTSVLNQHTGWTISCMPLEEFETADAAIDEAMRRMEGWRAKPAAAQPISAPPAAPALKAEEKGYPLHSDRIQEIADEWQCELMHTGIESFALERMIRHAMRTAEKEARELAEEEGQSFRGFLIPVDRHRDQVEVPELARRYMDTLLRNGVEMQYLVEMMHEAFELMYPADVEQGPPQPGMEEHYVLEGRVAARRGLGALDCPYAWASRERVLWHRGRQGTVGR